jgi:glucose/mannose transport system permease protein
MALTQTTNSQFVAKATRKGMRPERLQSFFILLPSLIALFIFIYVFIATTLYVSLSNWRTLKTDLSVRQPLFQTYADMFSMPRFQADIRNTIVFTIMFVIFGTLLGLFLAILLDHKILGKFVFRNIFLFPYALSFVVTGVAWRWIFNPETGVNVFFDISGINSLLANLGQAPLKPGWITDPTILWPINNLLSKIIPGASTLQTKLGIPAALIPVAIAATWQLSGFVMAMYLGGMATIPLEVKESAQIDGATDFQIYRKIIIPMLAPVTVSVIVILLHVSLKIFDLVFTMSGVGPGFATDVPAIFVFEMMFKATRYNLGSAAAVMMLVFVALVIVPYLARNLRQER